ncbi:hypothetical protein GJA_4571 [Janthinobacterium agaricidamnosum NBRC 102515 = DSM 9628]|uniref:Uncharacterized protein n=1 Tax=Janthinobacterium agaricidamnosum NBRC 102515 = DSM 9628 TaxID=1349767 RepID=W0VCS5_9BURK|nr:hypothetical protein GJA_4571 [Janthinobacterium agaricidamnosum NBRC 102515 = DSM 9628]
MNLHPQNPINRHENARSFYACWIQEEIMYFPFRRMKVN